MSLAELTKKVRRGDLEAVNSLLESYPTVMKLNPVKRSDSVSPLMVACEYGHLDMIKLLLRHGAEVDFQNSPVSSRSQCWSALMGAVKAGNVEVVRLLVEHGAQIHLHDNSIQGEGSALMMACKQGDIEVIKALLSKRAPISGPPITGKSMKRTSVLSRDGRHYSFHRTHAVSIAVEFGHIKLVEYLLGEGAEVPYGALLIAISKRNCDMVETLLNCGAPVNVTEQEGWSALMEASFFGESKMVKLLLEKGAEADLLNKDQKSALMVAAGRAYPEVVKLLLEGHAQVNLTGYGGSNALMSALQVVISKNDRPRLFDTIRLLLEAGADVNIGRSDGSPLMVAIGREFNEITKLLLEKGAKVNQPGKFGRCPLMDVVSIGNLELVRLLLDAGADTNLQDRGGKSCLMSACNAKPEVVRLLLEKGAVVNLQDNDGGYALLYAAKKRRYAVVELLLESGADPDLRTPDGISAADVLQYDTKKRSSEMAVYPRIASLKLELKINTAKTQDPKVAQSPNPQNGKERGTESDREVSPGSAEQKEEDSKSTLQETSGEHSSPQSELSGGDFGWICEQLSPHSYKWKEIAVGLHFAPNELSNIEANPVNLIDAPYSYLCAVMSNWLQWAPGDARGSSDYAKLDSLRRAVDKAGLGRLAQQLKMP